MLLHQLAVKNIPAKLIYFNFFHCQQVKTELPDQMLVFEEAQEVQGLVQRIPLYTRSKYQLWNVHYCQSEKSWQKKVVCWSDFCLSLHDDYQQVDNVKQKLRCMGDW